MVGTEEYVYKRRRRGFSGFTAYSSCCERYFKDVFNKHSFSFNIFHGRMQGSFTKTIEQKVMPTMSRSISNIIGESFASWQSKVDELLTQVAQNSYNTTQREDEDSLENKEVDVLFPFFHSISKIGANVIFREIRLCVKSCLR